MFPMLVTARYLALFDFFFALLDLTSLLTAEAVRLHCFLFAFAKGTADLAAGLIFFSCVGTSEPVEVLLLYLR